MKRTLHILLILLLAVSACTFRQGTTVRSLLQEVEGMLRTAPDTAYYLLQTVFQNETLTEEDSAYHRLLMAEAQLHNKIKLEDTTSLHHLVLYYKHRQDTLMQARALRLYAAAHRDLGYYDETVRHYNTAIALARGMDYTRLLADAYHELANVYYFEGLRLRTEPPRILADSLFYLTERAAEELKDTTLWITSLFSHSVIPIGRKQYAEWERQLLLALRLSEGVKDKGHEAVAAINLSILYGELGEKEKSFAYAMRNLALRKGLISEDTYCFTLGNAYRRIGQQDSADYYIKKGQELKEREDRSHFSTPFKQYLPKEFKKKEVSFKDFLKRMAMNDAHQQQTVRKRMIYLVSFLALVIVCVIFFIYLHKRHRYKEGRQREKAEAEKHELVHAHQHTQELLKQEQEELQRKKEEISAMQQEIDALASDTSAVFDKINRIVADYLNQESSPVKLDEADWLLLQVHIDKQWNHAVSRLQKEFRLTADETHLLCLYLADLPTAHIPFFFNRTINTIYNRNRSLCSKLGIARTSAPFKEDFKNFIHSRG